MLLFCFSCEVTLCAELVCENGAAGCHAPRTLTVPRCTAPCAPPPPAAPQVGSIVNFALMYLLAPVAVSTATAGGAASVGLVQKVFGEYYLTKLHAPGEPPPPSVLAACVRACVCAESGWPRGSWEHVFCLQVFSSCCL